MLWPIIAGLLLAGGVCLHLWWRMRFHRVQGTCQREIDRLRGQQRLASEQVQVRQAALFDSMAEGLLLLDRQGRIEIANRAFLGLFGITADLRARTVIEALRVHEISGMVDAVSKETPILSRELRVTTPADRFLEINAAAIFNGEGERHGTILVFHDLTGLKRLENTRQDFVANVSHELRTPLSLVRGYVETLLDGAKEDPQLLEKFLRTIERNTERLTFLIEDLLVISELESGRVKLNLQALRLGPLFEKTLEDYRARAETRQVQLFDSTGGELLVHADPNRVDQVIANLVENAIKYNRQGGGVWLGARPAEPGFVEISVRDDGPGVEPHLLGRLFERFYRVDKARSREQGGTGLGLSIVKHIVQTHGGKTWATSEVGKGCTFYFTLPAEPGTGHD